MAMDFSKELKRLLSTSRWSWEGWLAAWRSEKSLRQWAALNALLALASFGFSMTGGERALILALGILVLAAELINTAIEEIVDHIIKETHPVAKKAKDCGSALVAVTAVAWGVAWVMILLG